MSIRVKFNLGMLLVFAVGFAAAAFLVKVMLLENAKQEVTLKAKIMMEAARSARSYTVDEIRPLLSRVKTTEFFAQTVPAYAATENMKRLRQAYPEYSYKEAALNPTNPEHKAASWEEDIITYFRNYADVTEYVGVRSTPTGQYMFLSRPFRITDKNCLVCHSTPDMAPVSMVKKYGAHNGFGWKHNEVIGAQIVNVPMAVPIARADKTFTAFMVILVVVFVAIWLVINIFLHLIIVKRVNRIAAKAEEIAKGELGAAEFEEKGKDELSSLAHSLNLMYRSLSSAVRLLDKTQS